MAAEPEPTTAPTAVSPHGVQRALEAVPDALQAVPDDQAREEEAPPKTREARAATKRARHRRSTGTAARERSRARQRLRLSLAMIDCVAENGYRATRVADVIASAGVSRKTFYEHFENKQDCLLATYDLIAAEAMRRVEAAYRDAQGWPARVETAIRALFDAAIANPGALRLSLI
ncbi:MAG TPA: helix-turn-helix domain-containing protein, partial [Solirubrobacteraceae bacterium]|nr:helix-turn-helix domain-containing protein [Solirubrobacteraceae bacterium]